MHPALINLLKAHATSRYRRIRGAFSSPRRVLLSVIVLALTFVWVGQTLASMLLREPFAPDVFRRWVALPLMIYFLWHIVRVVWQRPDPAIEWLPEEEALVVGGPFTPVQVLTYRIAVILTATLPKAVLTTLVLWPDLSWTGPIGLLTALLCLELFRMVMDLATGCLSFHAYQAYRVTVILCATAVVGIGYANSRDLMAAAELDQVVPVSLSHQASTVVQAMWTSAGARIVEQPFLLAADVISGRGSHLELTLRMICLLAAALCLTCIIVWLERLYFRRRVARDRRLWDRSIGRTPDVTAAVRTGISRLPSVPRTFTIGPVVWRQCRRAWRYVGSLLVALGIPALLSLLPVYSIPDSLVAFISVVSGVIFYTFVLLPEAIKFDFRLDSDHMSQLRMLPMTSAQVVCGQLATPVLVACLFQGAVITFAGLVRQIDVVTIAIACGITLPLTIIFVAIDNLVYLLYPHRPTQEGFEAFLRTVLKFTGKSMLLVIAGGLLVFWAPAAHVVAQTTQGWLPTSSVFYAGVCLGLTVVAFAAVRMVVRAWDCFDVSLDVA